MSDLIRTPADALQAAAQWHLDRADECDRDASKRPDSAPFYSMRGLAHRSCAASMRQLASRIPPAPDDEALVKETPFRRGQAATNADEMSWQPLRPSSQPSVKQGRVASTGYPLLDEMNRLRGVVAAQAAEIERRAREQDRAEATAGRLGQQMLDERRAKLAAEAERDAAREALADVIMNAALFPDDPRLELADRALLDRVRDLIGLADLAASAQRARAALEPKP